MDFKKKMLNLLIIGMTLILWAGTGVASAHHVNLFVWHEDETVFTQSKFSNGRNVKNGKIIVHDLKGDQLLTGETDDKGEFSFKIPQKTALRIKLEAGPGLSDEWLFKPDDMDPGLSRLIPDPKSKSTHAMENFGDPDYHPSPVDPQQIENTIEKAMDKKLAPVIRMLSDIHDSQTSFKDVIGGIGYVLGLVGLVSFFHYRKKLRDLDLK